MSVTVIAVRKAGEKVLDWAPFIDPEATDALKRALQSPRDNGNIVLPPFGEKQVRWAISHVNKTAAARERELSTITVPTGKFS